MGTPGNDGAKLVLAAFLIVVAGHVGDRHTWGWVLGLGLLATVAIAKGLLTLADFTGTFPWRLVLATLGLASLATAAVIQPLVAVALATLLIALAARGVARTVALAKRTALNPHYREYGHALAESLAPQLGLQAAKPRRWINVSRDGLDGGIVITLPTGPALDHTAQAKLEEQVDIVLDLDTEDRRYQWSQAGRSRWVRIVPGVAPLPEVIRLTDDHLAEIAKLPIHRKMVGEERGGGRYTFDLQLDPHVGVFARTGWGKTTNIGLVIADELHKGGEVLILDIKFASMRHYMDLPGVTYANTVGLIHNALAHALAPELERRKRILGDTHWTQVPAFPHLLVIGEELMATYDELNAYWVVERQRIKAETGVDPGPTSPAITAWRQSLLLGRQLGIHDFAIAQRGDALPLGGGGARQQLDPRVFGNADRQAWKLAAGDHKYRPHKGIPGRAYIVKGADLREVQWWYGEDAQLRDFATSGKAPARTLDAWTGRSEPLDLDIDQPAVDRLADVQRGQKLSDLARQNDVKLSSLRKWAQRPDFPAVVAEIAGAKHYDPQEVATWLTRTGRTTPSTTASTAPGAAQPPS